MKLVYRTYFCHVWQQIVLCLRKFDSVKILSDKSVVPGSMSDPNPQKHSFVRGLSERLKQYFVAEYITQCC